MYTWVYVWHAGTCDGSHVITPPPPAPRGPFFPRPPPRRTRQVVGGPARHILLRRPAPLAVRVHRCAADELAVIIDVDVIDVGGCVAGEGWPCVVGDRAAGNLAGDRTDVVGQGDAVEDPA